MQKEYDENGYKQAATADTTNIQNKKVNKGHHICCVCGKKTPAKLMHWTTEPKLCISCFYEI